MNCVMRFVNRPLEHPTNRLSTTEIILKPFRNYNLNNVVSVNASVMNGMKHGQRRWAAAIKTSL